MVSGAAGRISLAPCLEAIAAGDNREVFTLSEEGILASAITPDQCANVADGDAGGDLVTGPCRSPGMAKFELSPSSQLKLQNIGNYCVSIQGDPVEKEFAGRVDAASMRWSSSPGKPVDFTLSLGVGASVNSITVDWEFAPKRFELALSGGGIFTTLDTTTGNTLNKTVVVLGGAYGRTLRIRMSEPLSSEGYAIKSLSVIASEAKVIVQDCDVASKRVDARDKFFMVSVSAADPSLALAARDTAKMAIVAGSRLGGLTSKLAISLKNLETCNLARHRACTGNCKTSLSTNVRLSGGDAARNPIGSTHLSASSELGVAMRKIWNGNAEALDTVIARARKTIARFDKNLGH